MSDEYVLKGVCDERREAYLSYFESDKENIKMLTNVVNKLTETDIKITVLLEEMDKKITKNEQNIKNSMEKINELESKPGELGNKIIWAFSAAIITGIAAYIIRIVFN